MTDCRQIESLLPPFVDGEADIQTVQKIESHLARCPACEARVAEERCARTVLRERRSDLLAAAPPGLRTRIVAAIAPVNPGRRLGWRGRLTAFAAAAGVLLVVAGALELVTPASNALYAAQLAIDHVRCFVVELTSTDPADASHLERQLAESYGWSIEIPPSNAEAGLTLVAARRCPFWLGPHAHLLYRAGDREVSLYVTPGKERAADDLHVLGHGQKLWTAGGRSYTLVTDDLAPAELARISSYLEQRTR